MNDRMLLIIVSRVPPTVTVTVIVKGEPAVAVAGAVKSRIACWVPQPNVIEIVTAVINKHSRRADRAVRDPDGRNRPGKNTLMRCKREFALDTPWLANRRPAPTGFLFITEIEVGLYSEPWWGLPMRTSIPKSGP